ncbi:MAG TPA: hypothetical protein PKA06_11140, partial [Gemmatales bacterium]|nr:hypothetical protein [Gemmatales bacterium]
MKRPLEQISSENRRPLLQLSVSELSRWLKDSGYQPWYARAIRRWVLFKRAVNFEEMSDLPKALRQLLIEEFVPLAARPARSLLATDGTRKLLLQMW